MSLSLHTSSARRAKILSTVRAVHNPNESKLSPLYKSAYFSDAFCVALPAEGRNEYTPEALARAFFSDSPAWFSLLMWIRDGVMSIFGVKRSTAIQKEAEENNIETIFVFPVISRTGKEIILGENDKHLNFQTSILIRETQQGAENRGENGKGQELVATTVVHCHGILGKVYITIIKYFHVMIVKYSLARVPSRIVKEE
ncbi:hypothetical protein G7046_g7938 [Stylonectria norvegica]|nr:hypothetical protein G7046_g7938 [Stylonectria norvegica]